MYQEKIKESENRHIELLKEINSMGPEIDDLNQIVDNLMQEVNQLKTQFEVGQATAEEIAKKQTELQNYSSQLYDIVDRRAHKQAAINLLREQRREMELEQAKLELPNIAPEVLDAINRRIIFFSAIETAGAKIDIDKFQKLAAIVDNKATNNIASDIIASYHAYDMMTSHNEDILRHLELAKNRINHLLKECNNVEH